MGSSYTPPQRTARNQPKSDFLSAYNKLLPLAEFVEEKYRIHFVHEVLYPLARWLDAVPWVEGCVNWPSLGEYMKQYLYTIRIIESQGYHRDRDLERIREAMNRHLFDLWVKFIPEFGKLWYEDKRKLYLYISEFLFADVPQLVDVQVKPTGIDYVSAYEQMSYEAFGMPNFPSLD